MNFIFIMNLVKVLVIFGIIVSSTLADPGDDPNNYAADKNADEDDIEFSSS